MNSYFEVGVRYYKTMEDGVVRKVTENYLLDALSFTEAEKRATEEMEAYISGEFRVVTEKITNIAEVVTTDDTSADKFYKVKQALSPLTRRPTKRRSKRSTSSYKHQVLMMHATANKQHIKGWLTDVVLEAVSETKYMDYFPYNNN